jgi:hypothetical protein
MRAQRPEGLLVSYGELARGLDGWNTFDTDKKLKTKAGQQTQETAVFFVAARLGLNAPGGVPAVLNAVSRRGMQLQYPSNPSNPSNPYFQKSS